METCFCANPRRRRRDLDAMDPHRRAQHAEDELLVLDAQRGDRAALSALVDRWHRPMTRLARHLSGNDDAAKDVVQDAWIDVVRGLRRLDDPARFPGWAMQIVRRRCADRVRRSTRQRAGARSLAEHERRRVAAAEDRAADTASGIREALRSLSPEDRIALTLRYLDGLTVYQVAEALDVPVGTSKSRLFAARGRLRAALESAPLSKGPHCEIAR